MPEIFLCCNHPLIWLKIEFFKQEKSNVVRLSSAFIQYSLFIFSELILLSSEQWFDCWSETLRFISGSPMTNNLALAVDEELLKVPLHVTSLEIWVVSQPFVERLLSLWHHMDFRHHWELHVVLLDEILNPCLVMGFLRTELVAWVGKNFETSAFEVFVHLD